MRTTTKLGQALRFAEANHDLLTTAVLTEEGLSSRDIGQLCEDRVLERIIRGLYRQAGTRTPLQDIAACLLRHPAGVASHVSGLFLHRADVRPPRLPQFTMPPGWGKGTRIGDVHRSPLEPIDVTRRHGLRVTTLARSVVDSSEVLSTDALTGVLDEVVTRNAVTIPNIVAAAERAEAAPGRKGLGRLRQVLAPWCDPIEPDSVAEAATIRRIRAFGLPTPRTQHELVDEDGRFVARLDMAWPDSMVAREYQSVRWHSPAKVEADEGRFQEIEALGWSVEPLYRYQLGAGEVEWLRELRSDLDAGRRAAS